MTDIVIGTLLTLFVLFLIIFFIVICIEALIPVAFETWRSRLDNRLAGRDDDDYFRRPTHMGRSETIEVDTKRPNRLL